jgi:hypothetical protein
VLEEGHSASVEQAPMERQHAHQTAARTSRRSFFLVLHLLYNFAIHSSFAAQHTF